MELLFVPLLGAFLPRRVLPVVYSYLSSCSWLFREQVVTAGEWVQKYQQIPDIRGWRKRARFHLLADQLDAWQTKVRGRDWLRNNLVVTNADCLKDVEQNILFITFHWGQGFWALKWLNDAGYKLAWLHAPVPSKLRWGELISGFIGRLRVAQVAHLTAAEPIPVQGSIEKMRTRLVEKKQPVMAMPDAPLQPGQSFIQVKLLGRDARLAGGLIKMAAREKITVCVYTISLDQETGLRNLHFNAPICEDNPDILAQYLADRLTEAVERDSSAWYVWPHASGFFRSAINPDKPG